MLLMVAYEVMSFAWSNIAERKAETGAELLTKLRPGYTTMDDAKALFQAHGVNVDILHNACGDARGACDGLYLRAANFPRGVISFMGVPWVSVSMRDMADSTVPGKSF